MFGPFYKRSQFQISFLLPTLPLQPPAARNKSGQRQLLRRRRRRLQRARSECACVRENVCVPVDVLLHMRINPATNCNYHNALQHNSQLEALAPLLPGCIFRV